MEIQHLIPINDQFEHFFHCKCESITRTFDGIHIQVDHNLINPIKDCGHEKQWEDGTVAKIYIPLIERIDVSIIDEMYIIIDAFINTHKSKLESTAVNEINLNLNAGAWDDFFNYLDANQHHFWYSPNHTEQPIIAYCGYVLALHKADSEHRLSISFKG